MTWKAYLQGHDFDLRTLARLFREAGDAVVARDDDGAFLTSPALDCHSDVTDVHREAVGILRKLNGVARMLDGSFRPVELVGRYDEGGNVSHIVVADTVVVRSHVEAAGVVVSGSVTSVPPAVPPALGPKFYALANSNPNVAEALSLIAAPGDLGWVDLYKLYEIVRDDLGKGQQGLISTGWITRADLSAFTGSANHPEAGGDGARHARQPGGPPNAVMTIAEAQATITRLVHRWMESLT